MDKGSIIEGVLVTLMSERPASIVRSSITQITEDKCLPIIDELATEEPMEVRVLTSDGVGWVNHSIAVTMRTPGNDFELAAGFLFSEGVVQKRNDIVRISYCTDPNEPQNYNIVNVYLSDEVRFDATKLSRHTYTSSSCGICGKGSLEQIRTVCKANPIGDFQISSRILPGLPAILNQSQSIFARTGGLHASGLFSSKGEHLIIREDVGRHNALDKLIGSFLLKNMLPASNTLLLVSGRTSFEIVQKATMAGIPLIASVGSPSSLAVMAASDYGMTLVGFLRGQRFNVYSAPERILVERSDEKS